MKNLANIANSLKSSVLFLLAILSIAALATWGDVAIQMVKDSPMTTLRIGIGHALMLMMVTALLQFSVYLLRAGKELRDGQEALRSQRISAWGLIAGLMVVNNVGTAVFCWLLLVNPANHEFIHAAGIVSMALLLIVTVETCFMMFGPAGLLRAHKPRAVLG